MFVILLVRESVLCIFILGFAVMKKKLKQICSTIISALILWSQVKTSWKLGGKLNCQKEMERKGGGGGSSPYVSIVHSKGPKKIRVRTFTVHIRRHRCEYRVRCFYRLEILERGGPYWLLKVRQIGTQRGHMKGVPPLPWLVRWPRCAGTRYICPALAALVGPYTIFSPHHTLFHFICP